MTHCSGQGTKENLSNAVTIEMARCSHRRGNDVALLARETCMRTPLGDVLDVRANAARRGLNVTAQIAGRRGAFRRSVAAGAVEREVEFDAAIDVKPGFLDCAVRGHDAGMAVRTLGYRGVGRRRRQAMATSTRCSRISRRVPIAGGRAMTVSVAALERLGSVAGSPSMGSRQRSKYHFGAAISIEMPDALDVGGHLMALTTLNRTMSCAFGQVV